MRWIFEAFFNAEKHVENRPHLFIKRLILTVCRNRPLIYSNNNPHVKRAVFRLSYKGLYFTKPLKELVKTGHRVYFHITILVNRSVQLVARNHECPKELNNIPCVIWSCIKMHAMHEIVNYASRLIIRATSCTLRGVK